VALLTVLKALRVRPSYMERRATARCRAEAVATAETNDATRRVFNALRLLTPRDALGVGKIRIGGKSDGGYVLLDLLNPRQVVMSFGIGPTVTFDQEMAERGHAILMFDHTIAALPGHHPGFVWYREGVAGESVPGKKLFSLAEHMKKLPEDCIDPILKMDVEGAEWDTLAATPRPLLRRFAQITLELHTLLKLAEPGFNARVLAALSALAQDFVPVHVHGNNCGALGQAGGLPCVDTLEITYVRRDLCAAVPSQTWYPTPLDDSNYRGQLDYRLWFFPFVPGSETLDLA